MLFPRVGFQNDEKEGLGRSGCTEMITVGWVRLGSPSGNSWPLLQENQMAKGDSWDSMSWNCTDAWWERSGMESERDNLHYFNNREMTFLFYLILFSWGCCAPWASVHSCCCSLSRVVFNIWGKLHYELGTGWCDQGRLSLCQAALAIQVIKISVWLFFSLWVWCCNVGLVETVLHTVARETSSSSFFFEFCHSTHSIAVIILLKVGRGSHEGVPVTDVRAGIDQTLWLESHQGAQGQQRGFCRCWRGVGNKTASTWIWIMCWETPPTMPAAMSQVQAYRSEMFG